jgi:peptide/nickel transport system permease protein
MIAYIVHRFLLAILIIFLVSILVFLLVRLLPGDPMLMVVSRSALGSMTEGQLEQARHEYGLDKPLVQQYGDWMNGVLHGEFGKSMYYHVPVAELMKARIPVTLYLGILSLVISNVVGILLGMTSALRRGRAIDTLVTILANIGITIPIFWLAIMLIYVFALKLSWLPVMGYTSPFTDFWQSTRQLIMPVFCLSIFNVGAVARQTRSSMLEVNREDYIRTAWAKGLSERVVVLRHLLRNGIIPVVTLSGLGASMLLGGAVIVETVFNIMGMGRLVVDGVLGLDYSIVQAVVLFMAVLVTVVNFIVDVSYGWIDPRIHLT